MSSWWQESTLQNSLLSFLCRDRTFLKTFGTRLSRRDFRANKGEGNSREIIADIALDYWRKYREPVGGMIKSEVLDYVSSHKVDEKNKSLKYNKKELLEVLEFITSGDKLVPIAAMEDKVSQYLETKFIKNSLEEVIELQEKGQLTKKRFGKICRDVNNFTTKHKLEVKDLLAKNSLEDRIVRRTRDTNSRSRPFLFIDIIDRKTKMIGRGDLGLWLAPLKKGKSSALAHTAVAYAKQRLKVLYLSLEDPIDEVEDRFDAAIAGIDIDKLSMLPNRLRRRFKKFSKVLNERIHIVDGTAESVSVGDIEELYLRERDAGFVADVIIVDYDDYIRPIGKYQKKLEAFDEIYKDFRRFLAKYELYGWTAAQCRRVKDNVKIITADLAADDIGKIRKATLVIGIGQGISHPDARYLYITAHKRGRMHVGGEVMTKFRQGLFYDRERSLALPQTSKERKKAA